METVARLLLRVLLVPLGGTVAIMVGMVVMLVAHRNGIAALANADPDAPDLWLFDLLRAGPSLAFLLSVTFALTILAAAVGVLIAEALAIRSWIYHAANGGLAAWIGWSMVNDVDARYRFLTEPKILVAAGLAGGLAYWLVAGWTAGFWKPVFLRQGSPDAVQP
jgi:hypothetical protein